MRDRSDAALARELRTEQLLGCIAERRDDAQTRNNDTPAHASPPCQRLRTVAAHWPSSVQEILRKQRRSVGRGDWPTRIGHAGSVCSWFSVAGRTPSARATTLAATSVALAPGPRFPK